MTRALFERFRTLAALALLATSLSLTACNTDDAKSGSCEDGIVVDGDFTGWPDCTEWHAPPIVGIFTDLYVDYRGGQLTVLNDWHLRDDAPIEPDWYNLFEVTTGAGTQQWDIRVYGDGHTEVLLNGADYPGQVEGAAGFASSPNHAKPHTIYEFRLRADPGAISIKEKDPDLGTFASGDDALVDEPTITTGQLGAGGGAAVAQATGATLTAVRPYAEWPGTVVQLSGGLFGLNQGTVLFDDVEAEVVEWGDRDIRAVIPPGIGGEVQVRVRPFSGGSSNGLPYPVGCERDCGDRECGNDGCGGLCGSCPVGHECTKVGLCAK